MLALRRTVAPRRRRIHPRGPLANVYVYVITMYVLNNNSLENRCFNVMYVVPRRKYVVTVVQSHVLSILGSGLCTTLPPFTIGNSGPDCNGKKALG